MSKLKQLEWEKAISEGITGKSGKAYRFESELSVARYAKAMELKVYMLYGIPGVGELNEKLTAAIADLNGGRFVDGSVKLKEIQQGVHQVGSRFFPGISLVSLYFNCEGEDRMGYNETDLSEKVKDWQHYGVEGFFTLALRLLNLQSESFKEITLTSSKEAMAQSVGEASKKS